MKFPLSWLKEHLDTSASLEEISVKLTALGLEVEGIEDPAKVLAGFVVGHVVSAEKHPDADKLQCLVVDTGAEKLKVVCGAPNARAGMKGVFAPSGSSIPGLGVTLKKSMIRGAESNGMMCSEKELCLSDEHKGIIELADDFATGSPAAAALGIDDPVIEINLTPNRGDCAGVLGVARDLAAAGLGKFLAPKATPVAATFKSGLEVKVEEASACPLFLGRMIRGVKNGDSPKWVQGRLKAVGARPLSALVDVTNYLCLGFARPAHVFDADKLNGPLRVRLAKAGETLAALNDKTYVLDAGMTVICDDTGVIALAGIVGGASTAVDAGTKNVCVEIAVFDPIRIARTGQKLQIDSDARYRFERGIDAAFAASGMEIATRLIIEFCGGEAGEVVTAGAVPAATASVAYDPARLKTLAGSDLAPARQKQILEALGFTVAADWRVTAPSWRHDIHGVADLVEEVLRVDGYDNVPAVSVRRADGEIPPAPLPLTRKATAARRTLAGRGLLETVTWSFLDPSRYTLFAANDAARQAALTLLNPISAELAVMRPSILPNLADAAGRNADRGYPDVALFEVGNVYFGTEPADQISMAAGLRAGGSVPRHWSGGLRAIDAIDVKADALAVLESCGVNVSGLQVAREAPGWYHPGRSGALKQGNAVLAHFGEMHPAVMSALGREGEAAAAFEVFLAAVPEPRRKGPRKELLRPSPFQPVRRDFAFVVDAALEADKLVRAVRAAERGLISGVEVFDVYAGKGMEPGKKSVAICVTLQPAEKTLTDEEIVAVCTKVVKAVEQAGGALRA